MSKYGAVPTVVDGIKFASKGESNRYLELKAMQKAGVISELRLQPVFRIEVAGELICKYRGDFLYRENGREVVEDYKGVETPVFKLKWKMVQALYPKYLWRISK